VYKQYSQEMLGKLNEASLERLICWRQDLRPADIKVIDSFCAFPREIVRDGNRVVGILMNEAPAAFLRRIPGKSEPQPRHAEALGRRQPDDGREVEYFPPPHKIAVLGVLLQRMIWLHDHNVVVSDLHPRNTLVTADIGRRDIYLLDCDSFWIDGHHAFPPHAPEMWQVGDGASASPGTDLAKFALFTARAVDEDFSGLDFSDEQLLRVLPSQHVRQLKRMYSVDPTLRTDTLRTMASSWTRMVKSVPGQQPIMYIRTDETLRRRWNPVGTPVSARSPVTPPLPVMEEWAEPDLGAPPVRASRTSASRPRPGSSPARRGSYRPVRRRVRHERTLTATLLMVGILCLLALLIWGLS
jgi:hypothetical protein